MYDPILIPADLYNEIRKLQQWWEDMPDIPDLHHRMLDNFFEAIQERQQELWGQANVSIPEDDMEILHFQIIGGKLIAIFVAERIDIGDDILVEIQPAPEEEGK